MIAFDRNRINIRPGMKDITHQTSFSIYQLKAGAVPSHEDVTIFELIAVELVFIHDEPSGAVSVAAYDHPPVTCCHIIRNGIYCPAVATTEYDPENCDGVQDWVVIMFALAPVHAVVALAPNQARFLSSPGKGRVHVYVPAMVART